MTFNRKHLLGIRELDAGEITHLLDTAETFRDVSRREIKKVPALRGRTVINLFFEPSTRTRTSFEIAAKRLSADAVNISVSTFQRQQRRDAAGHSSKSRSHVARLHRGATFHGRRAAATRENGQRANRQCRRRLA